MSLDTSSGHVSDPADAHSAESRDAERRTAPAGFAEFGLPASILRAIRGLGYEQPTAIQREAIPALLTGRDVTGVAQTGTGKTAAYGLPLLAALQPNAPAVQALVLVPTRELAIQVTDALQAFADGIRGLGIVAIYGGAPINRQITALKRGAQVVVGTPGRVIDLIERKSLKLDGVTFAVLDEADEMLRMGFAEDVDRILTEVPVQRQTALFSATMPKEIRRVAAQHLRQPVDVSVAASATPVANIEQRYIVLPFRDKAVALERVISVADAEAAVVFVRTRSACDELGSALIAAGVKAAFISGDVSQNERERTIDRLRNGQVDVLVATDVAARGMDVERIGLVVNFDAPSDPETYIHRVGRTGRAGRAGQAVTFFTPKETSRLRFIEKTIGRKLEEIDVPSAAQVRDRQAEAALAAAVTRQAAGRLDSYVSALAVAADLAGLSRDELAAALLATVVGDDGTAPVEIRATRRDRHDGAPRNGGAPRQSRDRRDETPRRGRDAADSRLGRDRRDDRRRDERQFADRQRDDRRGQRRPYRDPQADSRPYRGAPNDRHVSGERAASTWGRDRATESRDERRPYRKADGHDAPRRAAYDQPRKSKPRWDSARRAERDASGVRDGRSAGFSSRSGARADGGRPSRTRPNAPYRDRRPVA